MELGDEDMLPNVPTHAQMAAGAAAGLLEHCIIYPVDVVRTRMQSLRPQIAHQGVWTTVAHLVKTEKFKTFRGMAAVVAGAGPAHALYFSCYENLKQILYMQLLQKQQQQQLLPASTPNTAPFKSETTLATTTTDFNYHLQTAPSTHRALAHGLAGCGATLVHDAIMTPVEVVKQRMQMYKSPFRTSLSCAKHIFQNEGLKAFYRSYFTQLTMNLPYHTLHFVTYEHMQDVTNRKREYNPFAHVISGGVAGAVASAVTTPLDVCKTLLNTQEKLALVATKSDRITGLFNASRVVYKCCGFRGYFQGMQARVVVAIPSTAISWSVYEFFKYHYRQQQTD